MSEGWVPPYVSPPDPPAGDYGPWPIYTLICLLAVLAIGCAVAAVTYQNPGGPIVAVFLAVPVGWLWRAELRRRRNGGLA